MVDRIEENIKRSHNYVEKAVAETAAAVETSKKVRKVSQWLILFIYLFIDMTTINYHDHFFCFTEKDMDCNMPCYFACSIGHYPGSYFHLRWVPSIVLILNAKFMQAIQMKGVCYSQMCYSLWIFKINNVSFFLFFSYSVFLLLDFFFPSSLFCKHGHVYIWP